MMKIFHNSETIINWLGRIREDLIDNKPVAAFLKLEHLIKGMKEGGQ